VAEDRLDEAVLVRVRVLVRGGGGKRAHRVFDVWLRNERRI
jgi:hypothetical protein